jgi:hypothetical protein
MSDVTLSAAVRNNLLALQNTASMMATAQNQLATGKKVNSALDNPTNFFTASSLDSRANDLTSLLDGVSNGVQTLQAADTGIKGITSLVNQLQATARQALQASASYTTKASITSSAIAGISASNIIGTTTTTAATNATATATTAITDPTAATNAVLTGTSALGTIDLTAAASDLTFQVNGQTVTLVKGASYTAANIKDAINTQVGTTAKVNATIDGSGNLVLTSTNTAGASDSVTVDTFSSGDASQLGFAAQASVTASGSDASGGVDASGGNITFKVNGTTVTLSSTGGTNSDGHYSAQDVADAINGTAGITVNATATSGKLTLTSTGTAGASDAVTVDTFSSGDATQLGFGGASVSVNGTDAVTSGGLTGQTLTVTEPGSSTATTITFGTGAGQVSTLDALNSVLADLDLQASITSDNKLSITTSNSAGAENFSTTADSTKFVIGGTVVSGAGAAFNGVTPTDAALTGDGVEARNNFVTQYNSLLSQIDSLAQDSSFNGVNLLNGDDLTITMNETGSSKLDIQGVSDDSAGLGLSSLANADFEDSLSINKVLGTLNNAVNTLRSQSSQFGSNLSVVQTRQDFTNSLVNVLQTGSANLTTADTNQVSANLLALQTRQQLSTTALSMASQADQNVLRLFQ